MTGTIRQGTRAIVLGLLAIGALMLPSLASAAEPPIKELLSSRIGWEVEIAHGGKICTEALGKCQPAKASGQAGGFEYALGVGGAPAPGGEVYVADAGNHRIQELAANGEFVSMFGKEVNATTHGDICTAVSGNVCKAGVEGSAPGEFGRPQSIAVDPISGDIYVAEVLHPEGAALFGQRVQKFTPTGQFMLEIGKEVNETTKANLCTEEEIEKGTKCKAPTPVSEEQSEPGGTFFFEEGDGNILAVDGPEDLLYVGDEHRVQEFEADGKYQGQILLTSISPAKGSKVSAIAADKSGDVYLVYKQLGVNPNIIREFDAAGTEIRSVPPISGETGIASMGIALDASGRLAVTEGENKHLFGKLYETSLTNFHLMTEFVNEQGNDITFGSKEQLYATTGNEAIGYTPVDVAELLTSQAPPLCTTGTEHETSATLNCHVEGEVNPEEVPETEVWFQIFTRFGTIETARQKVPTGDGLVPVSPEVTDLRPNESLTYRLVGYDQNAGPPELLTSITTPLPTRSVPPQVAGEPSASYVHSSSAVLFGELNPENTKTTYNFEYGICEHGLNGCPQVGHTEVLTSNAYGKIGATLEASGLKPHATYHYRLVAVNEHGEADESAKEGSFETTPAPVPYAVTGVPGAVGTNSASVSGMVDPEGKPATYAFELGIYDGTATQYGVVFSGSAGTNTTPVSESLGLTGLQPATTYAYRIKISSGYGTSVGEAQTFTTAGLPTVLVSPAPLPMLAVPLISFPAVGVQVPETNARKLSNALKACRSERRKQRPKCEREAHKRYGTVSRKKTLATRKK